MAHIDLFIRESSSFDMKTTSEKSHLFDQMILHLYLIFPYSLESFVSFLKQNVKRNIKFEEIVFVLIKNCFPIGYTYIRALNMVKYNFETIARDIETLVLEAYGYIIKKFCTWLIDN
jgi:hypothetical protein